MKTNKCLSFIASIFLLHSLAGAALPPREIAPFFAPPEPYRNDLGAFRSPLLFTDGTRAQTAADWERRRQEIVRTWQGIMGPWPELIAKPRVDVIATSRRENITQQQVRLEIALGHEMVEGLL